ncbi:threonine aldolase family protein [Beduini massiliensis]|uniref:threonine aldolase family protein n=1 Tax=Beduini massiliensis TaxID=1585974 RepID=UPI00059A8A1B|nr:aminotransferase class I/II-fold pyridoxal phosphate-dependent enzyme [Beduini massiliensis]
MYSFKSDYCEGAHPQVMEALVRTNFEQTTGYSQDDYCEQARQKIKEQLNRDDVDIHFLVGGTQANLTVIASALKPYQACISADTGHINVHETGAVEATGHKVLTIPSDDGKITCQQVQMILDEHTDEHMVQPKMIYISNPTEVGTIYSADELKDLYAFAKANDLYLFVDGARLASALAIKENSMTLEDLSHNSDVFYIGGTKCGALFGEAVVIVNEALKPDFRYMMKQRGGMLAKGRLLGLQFLTLFENNLYYQIGEYENKMAARMRDVFTQYGLTFLADSPSNQLFPILKDSVIEAIGEKYEYTYMQRIDPHHSCIRLVTSFATHEKKVDEFIMDVENLLK